MNSSYADLASAYFVDDVPGATIPGSRLSAVLVKVDARAPLTVFQQEFLRARGYDALLELAIGQVDHEAFREKSRREKEKRLREKIAAQQREAAEQRRRDEATDRANKAFFAKREEEIERRRFHNRFGQGYIERGHYRRVMRILRSVANGNPIGADDILWLAGLGYWTEELRKAHHSNRATAFTESWHETDDVWQAINACSQWRKADRAETGLAIGKQALNQVVDKKLRSAALTTKGGALRDLQRYHEARQSGEEAHSLTPKDFRPCTLLGAVEMELGNYTVGADWYARAEARGATQDSVDRELRSILAAASPEERTGMKAALKSRSSHRYSWL